MGEGRSTEEEADAIEDTLGTSLGLAAENKHLRHQLSVVCSTCEVTERAGELAGHATEAHRVLDAAEVPRASDPNAIAFRVRLLLERHARELRKARGEA